MRTLSEEALFGATEDRGEESGDAVLGGCDDSLLIASIAAEAALDEAGGAFARKKSESSCAQPAGRQTMEWVLAGI